MPEISLSSAESKSLEEVVRTLEEVCSQFEPHLADLRHLRETAKTPLELELVATLEKSLEYSHVTIRMLINALTERSGR